MNPIRSCSVVAALLAAVVATPASAETSPPQQGYGSQQDAGQSQAGPSYMNDYRITSDVQSAISEDKQVNASGIQVSTDKGVVQLSGFASSAEEASHAEDVARQVPGVKEVKNAIDVKQSPQQ